MKLRLEGILKKGILVSLFASLNFTSDFPYERLIFYRGKVREFRIGEMKKYYRGMINYKPKRWALGFSPHRDLLVFSNPYYDENIRPGDLKKALGEIKRGNYDTIKIHEKIYYVVCCKRRLIEKTEGEYEFFFSMNIFYHFFDPESKKIKYSLGVLPRDPEMKEIEDDMATLPPPIKYVK